MSKKYSINSKEYDIQDNLNHKGIICMSRQYINWAKRYLSRVERRKNKQKLKEKKYE